jgi:thioredoxin 1
MKGSFDSIINDTRSVIVDFHATWCAPCKMQSPILKELASELGDRVKVIKIDVDQNNAIASRFQIQGVPTLIIFKEGKQLWRHSGLISKQELYNQLMKNI